MKAAMRALAILLALLAIAPLVACDDDDDDDDGGTTTTFDAEAMLTNYVNNVVIAIYENLDAAAEALETATDADLTVEANVTAAQQAWIAARDPWERSEAFLFGPVDSAGFDPRIDTWPILPSGGSGDTIESIIDDDSTFPTLDAAFFATADDDLKGFHAIEYLLFQDDAGSSDVSDIAAGFTGEARRLEYLRGAIDDLNVATAGLVDGWVSSGDDFGSLLITAGDATNTTYPTQRAAVEEMIDGMLTIADEVGAGKIGTPYSDGSTEEVESRYARTSLEDFQDNIRGIFSVWTGDYDNETGEGLDEFVTARDPLLGAQVSAAITEAIVKISEINQQFDDFFSAVEATDGGTEDVPVVADAIAALSTLADIIDNDLRTFVNNQTFEQ